MEDSFLTLNTVVLALATLVMAGVVYTMNGFRNDLKELFQSRNEHGERIASMEKACEINHSGAYDESGKRHTRRKADAHA